MFRKRARPRADCYYVVFSQKPPLSDAVCRIFEPDWINGFMDWRLTSRILEYPFGPTRCPDQRSFED